MLVRHVLLHRAEHRHVEVLVLTADVLHEIGTGSRAQFHLVRYLVVRIASLRVLQLRQVVTRHWVLSSIYNDGTTLRTFALPILMVQNSATHGSLTDQLHLLVVKLIIESETIEVCLVHSVSKLLLLAGPLLGRPNIMVSSSHADITCAHTAQSLVVTESLVCHLRVMIRLIHLDGIDLHEVTSVDHIHRNHGRATSCRRTATSAL